MTRHGRQASKQLLGQPGCAADMGAWAAYAQEEERAGNLREAQKIYDTALVMAPTQRIAAGGGGGGGGRSKWGMGPNERWRSSLQVPGAEHPALHSPAVHHVPRTSPRRHLREEIGQPVNRSALCGLLLCWAAGGGAVQIRRAYAELELQCDNADRAVHVLTSGFGGDDAGGFQSIKIRSKGKQKPVPPLTPTQLLAARSAYADLAPSDGAARNGRCAAHAVVCQALLEFLTGASSHRRRRRIRVTDTLSSHRTRANRNV